MATSGLDSIAQAVEHLERDASKDSNESLKGRTVALLPNHRAINDDTQQAHHGTRPPPNYNPPPNYHPYTTFPSYSPYGHPAPRLVSIDNMHHGGVGQIPQNRQPIYMDQGPSPGHMSPHHIRHDSMLSMSYHHPSNAPHMQPQMPASPAHRMHHEIHHWGPPHVHDTTSSRPSPPPYHGFSRPIVPTINEHHKIPRSSPALSVMDSPLPPLENQYQRHMASPSPPPALPTAVLTFASTLEEFLSMELDHSVYPPVPETSDIIVQVHPNDVLLGRGGETNHHLGNIQYRQLVKICQPAYLEAKRRDKPKIAERIVHAVRMLSGRFLKKDTEASTWRDVGNTRAREKTSQALREGAPELRNGMPVTPGTPENTSESRTCFDQVSTGALVTDASVRDGVSNYIDYRRDHRLLSSFPTNPVMSGVNLFLSPFASIAVTPTDSFTGNPAKRVKSIHDNPADKSFERMPVKNEESNSPNTIVTATVSGDDEEISSAPRSSDDERSAKSFVNSSTKALPRLKLLKRRFEQNSYR